MNALSSSWFSPFLGHYLNSLILATLYEIGIIILGLQVRVIEA